ncbi:hypothetical protein D3C78_1532740 [compost metagenome]
MLPNSSAAPTQSNPSGSDACPKALSIGSIPTGSPQPETWTNPPAKHASISGFNANCFRTLLNGILPADPYFANTITHRMFTLGTMAAFATAARAIPCTPNKPAAADTPT